MKIFLTLFLTLSVMAAFGLAADDHSNATEKKVTDVITINQPVKAANQLLPAGRYRVRCDRETLTFERINGKVEKFSFPCKGKELPVKAEVTELRLTLAGSDRVMTKLLLRGSTIEHTF